MDLKTYLKLFSLREFSSITNRGKKLILLVLVATISLWAIGFSSGASGLLKEKMDSPFVKFLAVDIPSAKADNNVFKSRIEQELADSNTLVVYDIVDYSYTSFRFNSFYTVDLTGINGAGKTPTKTAKIRPVDPQGELYSFMTRKRKFLDDTD